MKLLGTASAWISLFKELGELLGTEAVETKRLNPKCPASNLANIVSSIRSTGSTNMAY